MRASQNIKGKAMILSSRLLAGVALVAFLPGAAMAADAAGADAAVAATDAAAQSDPGGAPISEPC